jgi:putative endonuclease
MSFHSILSSWFRRAFPKKTLGQRGEAAAARFLRRRRYKIIARGDRLKHQDELDIVAAQGRTIVFVEVKTRSSSENIHPAEAVDPAKQHRLTRLAVTFLKRHGLLDHPARFDVVAVTWPDGKRRPRIEHVQNAFEAVGQWEFYS